MPGRTFRADQKRCRAAFFWAFGFFALVQLTGGLLLDTHGLAIRFPTAAMTLGRLAHEPPPDMVCLGSSRFLHGLPDGDWQAAMERHLPPGRTVTVFNAAVPAGDQISSELMLDQLLQRGVRPKWAVIEVTPESLNHFNTWLSTHVQRQFGWRDLPMYFADICYAHQIVPMIKGRCLPLFIHRKQLCEEGMEEAVRLWDRYCTDGEAPAEPEGLLDGMLRSMDEQPASALDRTRVGVAQVHRWLQHYAVGGTAAAALGRTLNRCRENGIRVILVRPPVIGEHRAAYTPEIESAFLSHVENLAAAYDCIFADYCARLPDDLFLDNHHLLAEGGHRFSELLSAEVLVREMDR